MSDTDAIDEALAGCTAPVGAQAHNIARHGSLAAGLPASTPAQSLDDGHRALRAAVGPSRGARTWLSAVVMGD